jgi:hypothetical protein
MNNGEKFTVNGDHILCLKAKNITYTKNIVSEKKIKLFWQEKNKYGIPVNKFKFFSYNENKDEAEKVALQFKEKLNKNNNYITNGTIIEIKVKDYLKTRYRIGKRNYYLYKNGIDFKTQEVPLDSYTLGYWLGDCKSTLSNIKNIDEKLETLNLLNNKHIPDLYKYNDKEVRLKLLAGIIDSDGYYDRMNNQYQLTMKNERLINDILYLSKSIQFNCVKQKLNKSNDFFTLIINGDGIEKIPVLLQDKRAISIYKNSCCYDFKINRVKNNNFYGFELDGNHRYLMGDFTVTHNSNGKSKILELFVHSLGMYSIKFPITMLTGKRAASNACTLLDILISIFIRYN